MKKSLKAILSCLLGSVILCGCSTVGDLSGTTIDNETEEEKNYREARHGAKVGTGEYDWVMYDVNIAPGETDRSIYHTNCGDDYISDIFYCTEKDYNQIGYDLDFNASDDFETFFVLSNGRDIHVTNVEVSHNDWFGDVLKLMGVEKSGWRIREIWIRTID